MECWISKIPCLACWEWWGVVMGVASFIGGVIADKLFLGKKIDKLIGPSDTVVINDLKEFEEAMARWEKEQNSKGQFSPAKGSMEDYKFVFTVLDLREKYWEDWLSIDESIPFEKHARKIREEAIKSISLIRQYGYKKAKKIRRNL